MINAIVFQKDGRSHYLGLPDNYNPPHSNNSESVVAPPLKRPDLVIETKNQRDCNVVEGFSRNGVLLICVDISNPQKLVIKRHPFFDRFSVLEFCKNLKPLKLWWKDRIARRKAVVSSLGAGGLELGSLATWTEPLLKPSPLILSPPSSKTCSKLGLINGMVLRKSSHCLQRLVFCIQTDMTGKNRYTKREPVLIAQRQLGAVPLVIADTYYIFDVSKTRADPNDPLYTNESFTSKDDPRFIGTFGRSVKRAFGVHFIFSLFQKFQQEEIQTASYLLKIPGNMEYLRGKAMRTIHIFTLLDAAEEDKNKLSKAVDQYLARKKPLEQIISPADGIFVHTNKQPIKGKDGIYRDNFGGRGKRAAGRSNMAVKISDIRDADMSPLQMIAYNAPGGKDRTDYSVDFHAPFNALQAFGFALMQMI